MIKTQNDRVVCDHKKYPQCTLRINPNSETNKPLNNRLNKAGHSQALIGKNEGCFASPKNTNSNVGNVTKVVSTNPISKLKRFFISRAMPVSVLQS